MFEASTSRPWPWRTVLGLVGILTCLAGGAAWLGRPLPVAPPLPPPAPIAEATPAEVKAALNETLAGLEGGRLFHLDCAPPGCVATVRMPIPRGRDAGWRNHFEAPLRKAGWRFDPPGKVEVFQAVPVNDDVLPERCYWTFGLRKAPTGDTDREVLAARIDAQSSGAFFRYDPW